MDVTQLNNVELGIFYKRSPYYKSTAQEIDPIKKIHMLGRIQTWIDHGISSTTNLPESITEEEVANIYMEAWKSGLKGLTTYRQGSRDGVLISSNEKKQEFVYHDAPKRPPKVECHIHKTMVDGWPYGIVVGLVDNKPYEIFNLQGWHTKHKLIKGEITKIKKQSFKLTTPEFTQDNINLIGSSNERRFNILLSGILRHGAHPKFVISFLKS